jgi:hypothetical protein
VTFRIVLEFETEQDADNWVAGYLDGGGEQTVGYVADLEKSVWAFHRKERPVTEYRFVLHGYRQCPKCRINEIASMHEFKLFNALPKSQKIQDPTKEYKCQNCFHECNESDVLNN